MGVTEDRELGRGGLSADEWNAFMRWSYSGIQRPSDSVLRRVRQLGDWEEAQVLNGFRLERKNRRWHRFWTAVGIAVVFTLGAWFGTSLDVHHITGNAAVAGSMLVIGAGIASLIGRETNRYRD
jgi:hypothetical protein